MAVGIRVRRPNTNQIVLDTTDYTMSMYFKQVVYITGTGSLAVSGLNLSDFLPVIFPYDYPPPQKMYPDYSFDAPGRVLATPRAYISGSSIVWECVAYWQPGNYVVMLVRYR